MINRIYQKPHSNFVTFRDPDEPHAMCMSESMYDYLCLRSETDWLLLRQMMLRREELKAVGENVN